MIIDGNDIIINGRFIKIASFKEEWDIDIENPERLLKTLKANKTKADIFTFMQRLPDSKPKFSYYMEWDSVAAVPIKSYDYWLKKQVAQNSRKKIGLAKRKGVVIKICEFDDAFVQGQLEIYHETPIRQGKPNWDYHIDFETAKKANATFLERSIFLGAYFEDELIGFLKIVDAGKFVRTMGIISKNSHRDKAPMNLLIAKAIELCASNNKPYLTYSKYDYGKIGSDTLKTFKRNLGFENIILPRYFIPLNIFGQIILKLHLQTGLLAILPKRLISVLLYMRNKWYAIKYEKLVNK